jgi:hypothetical protein
MAHNSATYTTSIETIKLRTEMIRSINGIHSCWEKMAREDNNQIKNDEIFLKKLDGLKFVVHYHPSWRNYKDTTLADIEMNNITDDMYLDWYHHL